MAKLSAKENFLRMMRGDVPEYVPKWRMGLNTPGSPAASVAPSIMGGPMMGPPPGEDGNPRREWTNEWGITYTAVEEIGNAGLPKPGNFILTDVTKWDKVVKWPKYPSDFFTVDWEAMAKKDLENINRDEIGVLVTAGFGPFQTLIQFMGFTEGLCALLEEPESVKEMLNYICDYYMPIVEKSVEYYKPDIVYLLDDTAAKYAPFFSVPVYKEIFKPIYVRLGKMAFERGIPIQFHNCGRCEDFVEDMVEFGVKGWDPAQQSNDLLKVKQDFKGKISICGAFDFVPATDRETTEEEVREYVRSVIDKFAVGGGYAFAGAISGHFKDMEKTMQLNSWIQNEVDVYGADFYR